jgi:hypothetical protein
MAISPGVCLSHALRTCFPKGKAVIQPSNGENGNEQELDRTNRKMMS